MSGEEPLAALFAALPDDLRCHALTHSSWAEQRTESYGRLAFLGDSVLGLAVAEELFSRFPRSDIGRLTKVHGQAVSGRACAEIAEASGIPEMLARAGARGAGVGIDVDSLHRSERAMASIAEALIGACYFDHGYERTAAGDRRRLRATRSSWRRRRCSTSSRRCRSSWPARAARKLRRRRRGGTAARPPLRGRGQGRAARSSGSGSGRSKKAAEQAAATEALEAARRADSAAVASDQRK